MSNHLDTEAYPDSKLESIQMQLLVLGSMPFDHRLIETELKGAVDRLVEGSGRTCEEIKTLLSTRRSRIKEIATAVMQKLRISVEYGEDFRRLTSDMLQLALYSKQSELVPETAY